MAKPSGTMLEEVIYPAGEAPAAGEPARMITVPLVRGGEPVGDPTDLTAARERVAAGLKSLPWDGLKLSHGDPAIPTRLIAPREIQEERRPHR